MRISVFDFSMDSGVYTPTSKQRCMLLICLFFLLRTSLSRVKVRSSEYPLSQIATAHISHIRGYIGYYSSSVLRLAS